MRNCNLKTLIKEGTRFGRLTIVKLTDKRNNSGNRIYQLKCDCGNICEKTSSDLKKSKDPIKHCSIGCPLIDRKNKKKEAWKIWNSRISYVERISKSRKSKQYSI